MIIDHIRNRSKYYFLGDDYKKALDFFAAVGTETFEKADILLPDSAVLIRLRPMITKDINDCSFEAHRKYADIHFVAYGKEKIGYNDSSINNINLVTGAYYVGCYFKHQKIKNYF